MRLIDADELLNRGFPTVFHTDYSDEVITTEDIKNAPTIELTASFLRQHVEDELIRVRATADQIGYKRGYQFGLEVGKGLKRPRAHWQVIGYHADKYFYCKCSNCKKKTKVFYDKTNPGEFGSLGDIRRNVHFCMFCGAQMIEEGREDET